MKRIISLLLSITLALSAFSHTDYPPNTISIPFIKNKLDTILLPKKEDVQKNKMPFYGMPNVITNTLPPIYKGNNKKGFDIYESSIDQMPILIPDSTNYRKMLISVLPEKNTPLEPAYSIPKFITKELEERKKVKDSLFKKKITPGTFSFPKK